LTEDLYGEEGGKKLPNLIEFNKNYLDILTTYLESRFREKCVITFFPWVGRTANYILQ